MRKRKKSDERATPRLRLGELRKIMKRFVVLLLIALSAETILSGGFAMKTTTDGRLAIL